MSSPPRRGFDPYIDKPDHGLRYQPGFEPPPDLPRDKPHPLRYMLIGIGGFVALIVVIEAVISLPRW